MDRNFWQSYDPVNYKYRIIIIRSSDSDSYAYSRNFNCSFDYFSKQEDILFSKFDDFLNIFCTSDPIVDQLNLFSCRKE